ncbi:MAG: thiamine-phosphate kinase [Candidatus Bathyarchaeota archaeon]|nr:thiamine-phosphate kinase [Candidatus Bathyarchaeota archaeon A05DMB-5]MDH7558288.1 thiamine-phosphate kinase [Candidatus Bathyarchaeota archaeon]
MDDLKAIGERKIIELILDQLEKMPKMPIPFGDDVSAYPLSNEQLLILKTDMLVDKTDVPLGMSLWQAARKAVIMNISDFAAKGVEPKVILVSLGLPPKLAENDIEEIGAGLNAGAREYGAFIIGGDTNEASDVIISLSVFGIAEKESVMLRSGAEPGDLVAVTGFFGKTSAGLKILLNNLAAPRKIREALVGAVLMPHARLKEGLALSRTRAVTAAIDSSDGLAWSLHEISRTSNVGFLISKLPVAKEVEKFAETSKLDLLDLTLYGGEEYELVLTVKPTLWGRAEKAVEKVGGKLLQIGKVTAEKRIILEINGKRHVIEPRGWEHFRKSNV